METIGKTRLACNVLSLWGMCAALTVGGILGASSGCLFPPELEPGTFDAGPGSPPVILSSSPAPEFSFPGPMILDRQDTRTLSLSISDFDLEDATHLRLFVDYNRPTPQPAYAECQAAPTGEALRVLLCPLNAICNALAETDDGEHLLEAMAADREFLPDSDPAAAEQDLYRALREPTRAAYSIRSWTLRCNPPEEL